jgi:glycosyltransferase involved in cell wall biosynthesis
MMFVAQRQSVVKDPTVTLFQPPMDLYSRLRRRIRSEQITRSLVRYQSSRPTGYEAFSDDRSPHGADVLSQLPAGDVINIHALYQFIDFRTFFAAVPQHTPVVRTLHDMSFFTGGCHTDVGCGKYTAHCGACPQLGSRYSKDLSYQIWQRKYDVLSTIKPGCLYLVTPSRWLANEAKRSALLHNFPVTVIPHGIDTEILCPRDRAFARDVLGVPQDARVVLFVGEPVHRPIKGFALLAQALNSLGDLTNLLLISVGSGQSRVEVQIPYLHLGRIQNHRLLSLVYSAADVFVIPSILENLPFTALEAIACGTPVIGFAVGGIPEIVRPSVTGLLVPPGDVTALRAAIDDLLQDPAKRAEMAVNCRRIAVQEYALEVHVQRYVELYQAILAGH